MALIELISPRGHFAARSRSGAASATPATVPAPRQADTWTASWPAWGSYAHVTVTDPSALPSARRLVSAQLAAAEKAAARFRADAEVHRLYRAGGQPITISPLLADLVSAALVAAERTDGDVDPTVAAAMTALEAGRSARRDRSAIPTCGSRTGRSRPAAGWQQVQLSGRRLQVPAGVTLDLSATAKAVACDRAAAQVRERLGVGVLVRLGGDAASAGPAPEGGWYLTVADRTGGQHAAVLLPAGAALASTHLVARPDPRDPRDLGPQPAAGWRDHLVDPRTGRAPAAVWRMATAIGFSSLEAATYTAAALVRGASAGAWLRQLWVPARLVTVQDDVITIGSWQSHLPAPADPAHPAAGSSPLANPIRTTLR